MNSIKIIMIVILFCSLSNTLSAQQNNDNSTCQYVKTNAGYLIVLREGADVLAAIENLVKEKQIPSGNFTGIGFGQEVVFGFYDFKAKKFNPKTFTKVEMGNLTGSIAWSGEKPSLHMHGIATDDKFDAYGGHILSLKVGTGSMEIYITVNDQKLERKVEQPLGANVLQLNCIK